MPVSHTDTINRFGMHVKVGGARRRAAVLSEPPDQGDIIVPRLVNLRGVPLDSSVRFRPLNHCDFAHNQTSSLSRISTLGMRSDIIFRDSKNAGSPASIRSEAENCIRANPLRPLKYSHPKKNDTQNCVSFFLELLGRFELPVACCSAAAVRRGFNVLRTGRQSEYQTGTKKAPAPKGAGAFWELLGRFELPVACCSAAAVRRGFDALRTGRQSEYQTGTKKAPAPKGAGAFLELLGRFELPTSSLPRMRSAS